MELSEFSGCCGIGIITEIPGLNDDWNGPPLSVTEFKSEVRQLLKDAYSDPYGLVFLVLTDSANHAEGNSYGDQQAKYGEALIDLGFTLIHDKLRNPRTKNNLFVYQKLVTKPRELKKRPSVLARRNLP